MLQPCGFIRSLDVIGVRPRGLCFKLVSDKLEARVELDRRSLEKAAHFHQANGWNSQKEYQKGPFHAVWPNLIGQVRDDRHRGLCPDYVHAVYSWSSRPLQVLSKRLCLRFVVVEKKMLF